MTAFDKSWGIVKMPIDRDSYEMGEDEDEMTADFIEREGRMPHSHGPFKIVVHGPTRKRMMAYVVPRENDPFTGLPKTVGSAEVAQFGPGVFFPVNLNVARGFRNRGLGSAMYDAIVEALKRRGMGERLKQSDEVSDDAMRMWGDDTVWPEEGRYA
tara:strand:+ start:1894 stop:2361 length:468 start_codon:yes stop_codon:yes gene_type:complete